MKSAVELIHDVSFLGVKKKVNDEFYTGQRQLRIQDDLVNEVSVEQIDVDTQSNSVSPTLSFCDAETQTEITGEFLDRLEFELKSTGEEKDQFCKRKRRVD